MCSHAVVQIERRRSEVGETGRADFQDREAVIEGRMRVRLREQLIKAVVGLLLNSIIQRTAYSNRRDEIIRHTRARARGIKSRSSAVLN